MQSKAIVVVGMHRSGTSAVSGLLAELGVFMGRTLFGPQEGVNEKGFYENALLVDLNDKLLDSQLRSWDDPLADCIEHFEDPKLTPYLDYAVELLTKDYDRKEIWGMKDPRTTLVLPFWNQVFEKVGSDIYYLLMLRHPFEVYGSLKKRDGFSLEKSLMLWLNYTLSGYFQCADKSLFILNFERLITSPADSVSIMCSKFGLKQHAGIQKLKFIDSKLKTQTSNSVESTELGGLAIELYESLSSVEVDRNHIIELSGRYENYRGELSPVLKEHLLSIKKEEVYFRNLFLDAYHSIWWKLSWPTRKLEKAYRKKVPKNGVKYFYD